MTNELKVELKFQSLSSQAIFDAFHDAVISALDEAGVSDAVLRGMCVEVGRDKARDFIVAIHGGQVGVNDCGAHAWPVDDSSGPDMLCAFQRGVNAASHKLTGEVISDDK